MLSPKLETTPKWRQSRDKAFRAAFSPLFFEVPTAICQSETAAATNYSESRSLGNETSKPKLTTSNINIPAC
jgi:hypothetical protein